MYYFLNGALQKNISLEKSYKRKCVFFMPLVQYFWDCNQACIKFQDKRSVDHAKSIVYIVPVKRVEVAIRHRFLRHFSSSRSSMAPAHSPCGCLHFNYYSQTCITGLRLPILPQSGGQLPRKLARNFKISPPNQEQTMCFDHMHVLIYTDTSYCD